MVFPITTPADQESRDHTHPHAPNQTPQPNLLETTDPSTIKQGRRCPLKKSHNFKRWRQYKFIPSTEEDTEVDTRQRRPVRFLPLFLSDLSFQTKETHFLEHVLKPLRPMICPSFIHSFIHSFSLKAGLQNFSGPFISSCHLIHSPGNSGAVVRDSLPIHNLRDSLPIHPVQTKATTGALEHRVFLSSSGPLCDNLRQSQYHPRFIFDSRRLHSVQEKTRLLPRSWGRRTWTRLSKNINTPLR